MDPSWTTEQKHAYTVARDWARQQLLPWAVADTYATWFATIGRNIFDDQGGRLGVVAGLPRGPQDAGPVSARVRDLVLGAIVGAVLGAVLGWTLCAAGHRSDVPVPVPPRATVEEDEPGWDLQTKGNRICRPLLRAAGGRSDPDPQVELG